MNLSAYIAELFKAPNLSAMTITASNLPAPLATPEQAEAVYKQIATSIFKNDRHNAVAFALALLHLDGRVWLARMRNESLFRASRYGYNGDCLKKIVEAALKLSPYTTLTTEQIQYLGSVRAVLKLARPARQIHRSIIDRLKALKGPALKTLLALVNSTFSINWMGTTQADESEPLHLSATDLASAYSRLYMIARENLSIGEKAWLWTDDQAASPYEWIYSSLLVDAHRLNELVDAEVLIDGLPYKAESTLAGVLVSAIDPEFERSVRLGYIQSDIQLHLRLASSQHYLGGDQPKAASFQDALSAFIEAGLLACVLHKEEPIERFVIALPNYPSLIELLGFNGSFIEEFPILHGALIDNFHPTGDINLQVSKSLFIMDLFKAQRLFNLIDTLFRKKLETVDEAVKRRILGLRSTVMVMPRQDLEQMLQMVMSVEKAQELISLLSLPTKQSAEGAEMYIDLQYRPFVHSLNPKGDFIAIPPAIVGKSNLVRSVMHASKVKQKIKAAEDPMQVAVASALRTAGFLVRESFTHNINGPRETDIFCYRDGVLFVIECKNAYHPCSPHELRNSYALLLTAEEQLGIRAQWLTELSNQVLLFKALGWPVTSPVQVRTCVVTANRAFSGYNCGGHPVRQAHELINVLIRGYVGRGPEKPPTRFWRSETFEVTDLLDYLDGKSVLQTQHAAMLPSKRGISLKEGRLEFAQFVMDLTEMERHIKETFDTLREDAAETS